MLAGCAQVFSLQRRMMVKTSRVPLPLEGLILHTYERSLCGRDIWATKIYAAVMAVAVPIMIQNAITNFVGMLDNIMVGQVGTAQMSGVAIVNQLLFVFNLCIFGAVSGAGIFTAQFAGSKDIPVCAGRFGLKS